MRGRKSRKSKISSISSAERSIIENQVKNPFKNDEVEAKILRRVNLATKCLNKERSNRAKYILDLISSRSEISHLMLMMLYFPLYERTCLMWTGSECAGRRGGFDRGEQPVLASHAKLVWREQQVIGIRTKIHQNSIHNTNRRSRIKTKGNSRYEKTMRRDKITIWKFFML